VFVAARFLAAGAAGRGRLPVVALAGLARRRWAFLLLVRAPGSVAGAIVGVLSVNGGGLPEERGEFAGAGDRDDAGGLAPLDPQPRPALVKAPLGAPGDLDQARVLALLATGERLADARLVAVVVGGLDQQPTGVAGAGLGDRPLRRFSSEVRSEGTIPRKPASRLGRLKRPKSPTSAARPAAESVSMPLKQRSLAITAAWPDSGMASSSASISVRRRPASSSTAAR
jgi:hypothetical protein